MAWAPLPQRSANACMLSIGFMDHFLLNAFRQDRDGPTRHVVARRTLPSSASL